RVRPTGRAGARRSGRPARRRPRPPYPWRGPSGWSSLQLLPDLAVALRGPDARPVDPGQLVPQPLHVEGETVLEDRPPAVARRERAVGGVERLLQRATRRVHLAHGLLHHAQEVTGLRDRR